MKLSEPRAPLSRLRPALRKLNPNLPPEALNSAINELLRDRSLKSAAQANREIYLLLKDGIKVTFRNLEGEETVETIRVIDWNTPSNNDFFMASQFWVSGEMYKRRADLIGFVKGLS
jgi:type I restriction enzyme R subunit